MASQENNLLTYIKNQKDHPFNFLEISDDSTKITTLGRKGSQQRVIYSGKKQYLEVLAREIFLNTYLKDEMNYYIEEKIDSDSENYRSDLITKLYGDNTGKQNIIEFKEVNSDISISELRNHIENAFSQVKHKYISERDGDLFVSVVFMDVEKIIKSPINLEKFLTIQDKEKIKDQFNKNNESIFKKFGISIITKKFEASKNDFSKNIWFHTPKHCLIEIDHSECDQFDMPQKVANIKDAIKFPTTSSCYGIKNVRDIKDPLTSDQKRNLLLDIMETTVEAFSLNNSSLVHKYGKEKDFVFIRDESIVKKYRHKDVVYYSLTTMNGAIIDGQNSIDCFKIILDFIDNLSTKSSLENPKHYDKMEKKLIKYNIDSEYQRKKLKKFIEDLKITIKTTETDSVDEALQIAVNKNNTMPVSSNELVISRNSERIYIIGNSILEKSDIILGYPKRQYFGVSEIQKETSVIECDFLAKACQVYHEISNNQDFASDKVFSYKQKMVTSNAKKAISEFCEKYSTSIIDDDLIDVKKIDSKIEMTEKDLSELQVKLKTLKENDCSLEKIEETEISIDDHKSTLKEYKKQRELASISTYEAINTNELINISNILLRIKWYVKNIESFIPVEITNSLKVSKDNTFVCYCYILLLKNAKLSSIKNKGIKDDIIKDTVIKFFYNYYNFEINYTAINITGINHNNSPDATTTDKNGHVVYLRDISKELFDVSK